MKLRKNLNVYNRINNSSNSAKLAIRWSKATVLQLTAHLRKIKVYGECVSKIFFTVWTLKMNSFVNEMKSNAVKHVDECNADDTDEYNSLNSRSWKVGKLGKWHKLVVTWTWTVRCQTPHHRIPKHHRRIHLVCQAVGIAATATVIQFGWLEFSINFLQKGQFNLSDSNYE